MDAFLSLPESEAQLGSRHGGFYLSSISSDDGITFHREAHPGSDNESLRASRLERFLADPKTPLPFTARIFECHESRERAIAEVDGMHAGLTFLDKAEKARESCCADTPFCSHQWCYGDLLHSAGDGCFFWKCPDSFKIPVDKLTGGITEGVPNSNSPHSQTRRDLEKAWRGLHWLREYIHEEFEEFSHVAAGLDLPGLRSLRSQFLDPKDLADCGTLVYRDVLDGIAPDTLGEVFAFASRSHAVSRILVGQDRMQEGQVLSGLHRWGECIQDAEQRAAFDALASKMWPSSFASSPQPGQPPTLAPLNTDECPHALDGQDDTFGLLRQTAAITSAEISHLSVSLPDGGHLGAAFESLAQDVLDVTTFTQEEFNFSLLRGADDGAPAYAAAGHSNLGEMAQHHDPQEPIPAHSPLPLNGPVASCHSTSTALPPGCQPPSHRPLSPRRPPRPRLFDFQISDTVSVCAAQNLRNTVAFLAVSAFAQDAGEGFYLLSCSGRTVSRTKPGSVSLSERSKAEKRLRRAFFEPLKRAGADHACFVALLAVAKKFVTLGSLSTEDDVQDYLLNVSKRFLSPGPQQVNFIRWIFGQSRNAPAARDGTDAKETGGKHLHSRRRRQPGSSPSYGSQRERVFRCDLAGCESTYRTPSGLSKHKRKHAPESRSIRCEQCNYSSERRDIVRQHFLRKHGSDLPPSLRERRRGHA